jgi:hypothetical protein
MRLGSIDGTLTDGLADEDTLPASSRALRVAAIASADRGG